MSFSPNGSRRRQPPLLVDVAPIARDGLVDLVAVEPLYVPRDTIPLRSCQPLAHGLAAADLALDLDHGDVIDQPRRVWVERDFDRIPALPVGGFDDEDRKSAV